MILFIMLLVSAYLHFMQSSGKNDAAIIYEQISLTTDTDCNIVETTCEGRAEELSIDLKFGDKPSGLKAFPVVVTINNGAKKNIKTVLVNFTMKNMSMGKQYRTLIKNSETSQWEGQVILPICSTGRRDWHVTVDIISESVIFSADYEFELQ